MGFTLARARFRFASVLIVMPLMVINITGVSTGLSTVKVTVKIRMPMGWQFVILQTVYVHSADLAGLENLPSLKLLFSLSGGKGNPPLHGLIGFPLRP